jgi:hypothetical protein
MNEPKKPRTFTLWKALVALFLLCLFLTWYFGRYLHRR